MRVKFTQDEEFEYLGRHQGHTFKAGETYEFDEPFARRWIGMGSAEAVDGHPDAPENRFKAIAVEDPAPDADEPPAKAAKAAKGPAAADPA